MNGLALGADGPLTRVAIVGHAQHNQFPAIFAMFDAGAKQNMFFLCAETGSIDLNRQRGQASDKVVGQVQRYMGYAVEVLADTGQTVRGAIIALEDDLSICRALLVAPNIQFYRYKVDFKLEKA